MYHFWAFFSEKNKFSYLLLVALLGFGIFSLIAIPKESTPEVQIPVGVVATTLPGASAVDIESLVTNEIEQHLSGNLDEVKRITSSSREGASFVTVEFEADADIDESIRDLKDEIDTVIPDLPDDANTPIVSDVNFVDQPIMTIAVSGNLSEAEFAAVARELEDELESIRGVSEVEKVGVGDRRVSVVVDQSALARFEMSVSDVISAISRAGSTFPVGTIETNDVVYNIAFEGDITESDEIASLPLGSRSGSPILVRDVADVFDGFEEVETFSRLSIAGAPSKEAISFNVTKRRGGDITTIAGAVNERLRELQGPGELLEGLEATAILDAGEDIKTELGRLLASGSQTIFLVVLLLIITIGWREGLIAGVAIPLSFLIGFVGLYLSDNTVNFVSLFALILAVGILVDSAIVMVEGIHRRMKADKTIDKKEAALRTIREFHAPLTSGTLTTIAMFSGLFLVGGVSGQFISAIPFTINFVLLASLLVALGFIPLIAALFLRRRDTSRLEQLQEEYSHKAEAWYEAKLRSIIGNRKRERLFLTLISVGFILALLLPITGVVKTIFFDQEDIDWIYAEIEMPQGTAKEITDLVAREGEDLLYDVPNIESFITTVGASSAFASNAGASEDSKFANYFITLEKDRNQTSTEMVEVVRERLSIITDAEVSVGQPNSGPPTGAPIVVKFMGDDIEELSELALRGAEILRSIPNTTDTDTSTKNNSTEFVLTLDKEKAAALGLDPLTVSQALRSAVYGAEATEITSLEDDIEVFVKLALNSNYQNEDETTITSIDVLERIELPLPNGGTVLLSSLVETSLRESNTVINHEDRERVITLSSNVTAGGNVREVTAEFTKRMEEEVGIPNDVVMSLGGEDEESQEAFMDMFIALIVGMVGMFAILILQFNSYRHALYVLSILPFSLIGIMAGLAITGKALSFPSMMGFIALSGIVVNNSILLIDQMNNNRRKNGKEDVKESVVKAAVSRLRPILLTTATTVVGIFPLTFASDLWSPLAYAVMFGLSFSVIITLLLVPILYSRKPGKV